MEREDNDEKKGQEDEDRYECNIYKCNSPSIWTAFFSIFYFMAPSFGFQIKMWSKTAKESGIG